jgi:hypothetical protein
MFKQHLSKVFLPGWTTMAGCFTGVFPNSESFCRIALFLLMTKRIISRDDMAAEIIRGSGSRHAGVFEAIKTNCTSIKQISKQIGGNTYLPRYSAYGK